MTHSPAGVAASQPIAVSLGRSTLSDLQDALVGLVARWGYERREEPFQLSSGYKSRDYIDGKKAISTTSRLRLVGKAILDLAQEEGLEFDAVGGLTMGADPIALAVTVASSEEKHWFSVRKEEKKHGKQRKIEGTSLDAGVKVLLVDDVVTTGRSILDALEAIQAEGAEVVLAVALVDRGEQTASRLAERNVKYRPLITYKELGIEAVPG